MDELIDNLMLIVRGVFRHKWLALALAWTLAVTGWFMVSQLDDKYKATARIVLDHNEVLEPLLNGLAIQPDLAQRVLYMTQSLLNRPNLKKLIDMAGLSDQVSDPIAQELLLEDLAQSIKLQGSRGNRSLYSISYMHTNPETAKRVVESLIRIFIDSSLGEEQKDSQSAQAFLTAQINTYEERLMKAEASLADFKRKNAGKMPSEAGNYYQRLEVATRKVRDTQLELRETENRRAELNRQISSENTTIADLDTGYVPPLKLRLQGMQDELDQLLVRYTDRHPRVAQITDNIADLQRQISEEEANPDYNFNQRINIETNPVYQRMRTMLSETDARVAELKVRVSAFQQEVADLNATINSIPKIEAELQQLNRDYGILNTQYETILQRRESARLSEQVEQNVDDIKFRVVDAPFVPSTPTSPNKRLLNMAVLLLALGAGAGLSLLLSLLKPVYHDLRSIAIDTGLPTLGSVSRLRTPTTRLATLTSDSAIAASFAALMLTFFLVFTNAFNSGDSKLLALLMNNDVVRSAGESQIVNGLKQSEIVRQLTLWQEDDHE